MVSVMELMYAGYSLLLVYLVVPASGQMHGKPPTTTRGQLRQRTDTHDYNHIVEHMDGVIQPEEKYSDEEMQFHYFKAHDYDDNNKLDGIELIAALTHYHKDDPNSANAPRISDFELANMIDNILHDDDVNSDGYIDYPEFIRAQRGRRQELEQQQHQQQQQQKQQMNQQQQQLQYQQQQQQQQQYMQQQQQQAQQMQQHSASHQQL